MKDKTKYILMGIAIGIVIGIALFYLLLTFGIIRPFGLGNFGGMPSNGNFTNFSRHFRG